MPEEKEKLGLAESIDGVSAVIDKLQIDGFVPAAIVVTDLFYYQWSAMMKSVFPTIADPSYNPETGRAPASKFRGLPIVIVSHDIPGGFEIARTRPGAIQKQR